MTPRLPAAALLLGLAGLIPFLAYGYLAVGVSDPVLAERATSGLVFYGAVILAFLGGVHWGFALAPPGLASEAGPVRRATAPRLVLGVIPSLIAWVALLTVGFLPATVALAVLLAGFIATVATEWRFDRQDVVPKGYMRLRYGLSLIVCLCLGFVLIITLAGGRIIF